MIARSMKKRDTAKAADQVLNAAFEELKGYGSIENMHFTLFVLQSL